MSFFPPYVEASEREQLPWLELRPVSLLLGENETLGINLSQGRTGGNDSGLHSLDMGHSQEMSVSH